MAKRDERPGSAATGPGARYHENPPTQRQNTKKPRQNGEIDPDTIELTDAGNAERFMRAHGADVRYVPQWGWIAWTGTHWERNDLSPRERMVETARGIHAEAVAVGDPKAQAAIASWARRSQQGQRIQAALWLAQPAVAAHPDQFDRDPWLFGAANGTIDLRSGELLPHRREHFITRLSPAPYDPQASAPIWDVFLARVLPDPVIRAFMRRLVGYFLTGLTIEQKLAFLYGFGSNGKSVFTEAIAAAFGPYHAATRIDTLSIGRNNGIPNDLAALVGARVATVSETPEGSRLNESLVKDLTGGDTITARFLHREFFQFSPSFKMLIRGNHKPQIRGTDDGIWRRILLIPFEVQIPPDEVDPDLPRKLRDELPGILRWAVDGCLEWRRDGLNPPQRVMEAVDEYRRDMDRLGMFIDECCLVAPTAQAPASGLYQAYRTWCETTGEHPISQRRFGESLAERGFQKTKPKGVVWHGLGLASDLSEGCDLFSTFSPSRAHDVKKPQIRSQRSEGRIRGSDDPTDDLLAAAVAGLGISMAQLRASLSSEDLSAISRGEIGLDTLRAYAEDLGRGSSE